MTKPNFTSINVLLDASGSMSSLVEYTIGGFNAFVEEQKNVPGEAILSLCAFDTRLKLIHDCVPLQNVPALTRLQYYSGGYTALLDAVGTTMDATGAKFAAMPEEERPSKVIFLIVTDGLENASRKFKLDQIKEMISHQKDVYSWDFVFTGANIDSFSTGASLGVGTQNSANYVASPAGTRRLYQSLSKGLTSYRMKPAATRSAFFDQNDKDQLIADPNGVKNSASPLVTPPADVPRDFNPQIDLTFKIK